MSTIYNTQITYKNLQNQMDRNPTTCHIAIYQSGGSLAPVLQGKTLVVSTELYNNHGKSITNSAESLATYVVGRFHLDPSTTTFVEHYNAYSYTKKPSALAIKQYPDTYAVVSFQWDGLTASHAGFTHIKEDAFNELVREYQ